MLNYEILEKFEAGIELRGYEVKAIRIGRASLKGAFVIIRGGQAWLLNAVIPPYQSANVPKNYDPQRTRRLLLGAAEIKTLIGKTKEKNLTIMPIKFYNKGALIKLAIGLARGRGRADRRELIKKRDIEREIGRRLKG